MISFTVVGLGIIVLLLMLAVLFYWTAEGFKRKMNWKRIVGRVVTALITGITGILVRKGIDLFFKFIEKWTSMLLTGEWLCVIMYL